MHKKTVVCVLIREDAVAHKTIQTFGTAAGANGPQQGEVPMALGSNYSAAS